MCHRNIGIRFRTQSVTELIFVELNIDLNRASRRLIFHGLRGIDIAVSVYRVTKEGNIVQKRIATVILRILSGIVERIHVRIVVVPFRRRRDLCDHKLCIIRNGICLLEGCRHRDIDITVGIDALLTLGLIFHVQGGIGSKVRVIRISVLQDLILITALISCAAKIGHCRLAFTVPDVGLFICIFRYLLFAVILCNGQLCREGIFQNHRVRIKG